MHPEARKGAAVRWMPRWLAQPNLIVAFHAVPSAEWFAMALRTLGAVYRFVSAREVEDHLRGGGPPLRRCAHVTFDDGDRSVYEHAFPVLRRMRVPATLFVSPRVIREGRNYWFQDADLVRQAGGDEALRTRACSRLGVDPACTRPYSTGALLKLLPVRQILEVVEEARRDRGTSAARRFNVTLHQLRELHQSGYVTLGAHTLDHPILSNESDADAEREIRGSVAELGDLVQADVRTFAFPNGQQGLDFSEREQRVLCESGVRLAVSTEQGPFGRFTDPLAIPRLNLNGELRENARWIALKTAAVALLGTNPEPPEPRQRRALIGAGIGAGGCSLSESAPGGGR